MLLYYITDRKQFPGSPGQQHRHVISTAVAAARAGVDFIQLREKDLTARELETLARQLVMGLKDFPQTRLLVNSRTDVAIAAGANGVHLPANDIPASEARVIFAKAGVERPIIAASCHTAAEIADAESHGADFAVFGPVFEKDGKQVSAAGLAALREAARRPAAAAAPMPILALGGVTLENAAACLASGSAGIAGIRLFQTGDLPRVVEELRRLEQNADSPQAEGDHIRHPYWPAGKYQK